ncbi:MAG: ATP-grasp domain-containing protein [Promethearchaeota archaeon]
MSNKKIFIFEYVAGGGFNKEEIPPSLLCEGFGMLRSIIADFHALDFQIITLLDYRISFLKAYLQAEIIIDVKFENDYLKLYKDCVEKCSYCFIIAPEFFNILYNLTNIAKKEKKKILSIDLKGISLGASKIKTYKLFKESGLNTPKTFSIPFKDNSLDYDFIVQKLKAFNTPIIIKPEDGVGAESIYYFENKRRVKEIIKSKKLNFNADRNYILQNFIDGNDLSVSLIGGSDFFTQTQNNLFILSINSQDINIKNFKEDSEYKGGYTPIQNFKKHLKEIKEFLKKLKINFCKGYFGIDFIRKSNNSYYFIEINPRLTTSYIGLRNIFKKNIAELIYKAKINDFDNIHLEPQYFSLFQRLEFEFPALISLQEIYNDIIPNLIKKIPEFVTPPISLNTIKNNENYHFSCFVATKTKNLKNSFNRMSKIREIMTNHRFKILNS